MRKSLISILCFITIGLMNLAYANDEGKDLSMDNTKQEKATFAGGCFWCMQYPFDKQEGVVSTTVGYIGGHKDSPTYEDVCAGNTGHAEAIEILYVPSRITYSELLGVFWKSINPTTLNKQFVDAGTQYRTAIFYHNEDQKLLAEESKKELDESGKYDVPIVTEIVPASTFYKAEEYHQKYYEKNSIRYKMYKNGTGRDQYLEKIWGKGSE